MKSKQEASPQPQMAPSPTSLTNVHGMTVPEAQNWNPRTASVEPQTRLTAKKPQHRDQRVT